MVMTKKNKSFWLNPKQFQFIFDTDASHIQAFFKASDAVQRRAMESGDITTNMLLRKQKNRTWVGGRGTGKTTTLSYIIFLGYNMLPRAKAGLAGISLKQLKNNTLSEIKKTLRELGVYKDIHYKVGVKPASNFKEPYYEIEDYKNAIIFNNGFAIELYAETQEGDSHRGGSLDMLLIDEYAFLNKDWLESSMYPLVRANKFKKIAKCPLHGTILKFTSAPPTLEGQFVFKDEIAAKEDPTNFYYLESTAYDNIEVLGEEYINTLRKSMSKGRFEVEILNRRITKPQNAFYQNFVESKHIYSNSEGTDINPNLPLSLSFDFNASFTSMIVCQGENNTLRIVDVLFVKYSTTTSLVGLFCKKHKNHNIKSIDIYGDRTGYKPDPTTNISPYEEITHELIKNGFYPNLRAIQGNIEHYTKFQVFNKFFKQSKDKRLFINSHTCQDLLISIYNSLALPDFQKDKRIERLDIPEESMTHLSDAFDYILFPFITRYQDVAPDPKDLM